MSYRFAPAVPGGGEPGLVSVVLVHHRGTDDLARALASIAAQPEPTDVVVVDNGAVDPLPPLPRGVRLVRLPRNIGFGAGVNAGLQVVRGDRVLLLNPDAELAQGCLAALLGVDADVVAPRILLRDDAGRLDNCGHDLYPDGLNWCRGRGLDAAGRYEGPEDLLIFSGAAVLFTREALVRTGGFDPAYFAYGEDAELSLRAARLGLRCRYEPSAIVHHAVGGAFGRSSLKKAFLVERNRARVAWTHLPAGWLVASPVLTALRHAVLFAPAVQGRGVGTGWSPRQRALLPFVIGAATAASIADVPGSLRRRWAMKRLAPATKAYRTRLSAATIGPRALLARPQA